MYSMEKIVKLCKLSATKVLGVLVRKTLKFVSTHCTVIYGSKVPPGRYLVLKPNMGGMYNRIILLLIPYIIIY